ncbi:MAG: CHAT domain-containing protein [Alkalinema sp. RU_4_3]|nr:CHAT domain-containing protein [Alkalinema sp. RU_4_3]
MKGQWSALGLLGLGTLGLAFGFLVGGQGAIAQVPTNPPLLAQASNDRKGEADRLYKLGVQQADRQESAVALVSLQQALQLYQGLGDRNGQMDTIRYLGWAQHQLKNYPQAMEQFQASLAIAREINSRSGEAKGLNGVGSVHEYLKETDKALANYEQARSIAIAIKDMKLESLILENVITTYRSAGNWQKEIEVLNRNLAIYRELKQRNDEASNLSSIGIAHFQLKDYQQSIAFHQQSLAIYTELNNQSSIASTLRNIGLAYDLQKDYSKAIASFEQSLTIYRELKNERQIARGLIDIGLFHKAQKNYIQANKSFLESLEIYTKLNDRPNMAQNWRNLGWIYEDQQDWAGAIQAVQKSLALRQELKDSETATSLLLSLGLLFYKHNNYPQAISYYEQYLTAMRQRPSFKGEELVLKIIGDLYRSQPASKENSEKAIKYYDESLKIAQKNQNELEANHALHSMGIVYQNYDGGLYSFKKATEYLEQSLDGWRKLKDNSMEADTLYLLGNLYVGNAAGASAVGNDSKTWCDQGIAYLEKSIGLLQSLKKPSAGASNSLGRCYQETKQYQKAIKNQEQGLILAQKSQNRLQEGLGLVDLARSYRLTGNLSKAEQLAQQGVNVFRELKNHQWEVYALDEITSIYVALGKADKAIETQNRRIAIAYTHNVRLVNYGFNASMVKIEKAKKFNFLTYRDEKEKKLRQQLSRHNLSTSLLDLLGPKATAPEQPGFFAPATMNANIRESLTLLGDAYAEVKQYPQAIEFYKSALDEEVESGDSFGMIDIDLLTKLGKILQRVDRMKESEFYLRLALKHGEEFRTGIGYGKDSEKKQGADANRIFLADRKIRNFKQLQQLLIRLNRSDEALETAEEARARTFVELLASRTRGLPLGDKLPTSPNVDAMRQVAKQRNATLVQYSIAADNLLYIWVIKPTGEISFRSTITPDSTLLSQLVTDSRTEMGVRGRASIKIASTKPDVEEPNPAPTQENLKTLHRLLIEPIAQDLPSDPNQQVIFLPQDELFLVPFAALPDQQGRYLIERHTMSIAPSIQTLEFTQALAQRPKTQKGVVIVGDPKMPIVGGLPLQQLKGAREEATNIAQLFQIQPLLGEQATKAQVLEKMKTAKILHLATHGLLDNVRDDMPGSIALAPSGQDSGLWTSGEIFDLKLNLDLVVLSACDTGRGKITGDGVVGLARSFFAAGSSSVLVSLWAVNDGSTNALMSEFYRQLQTEPNKSKALRQAMLKTKQRHPNPIDWAAFTLIGEN